LPMGGRHIASLTKMVRTRIQRRATRQGH
jgi:hypothetical protein